MENATSPHKDFVIRSVVERAKSKVMQPTGVRLAHGTMRSITRLLYFLMQLLQRHKVVTYAVWLVDGLDSVTPIDTGVLAGYFGLPLHEGFQNHRPRSNETKTKIHLTRCCILRPVEVSANSNHVRAIRFAPEASQRRLTPVKPH